MSLAAVEVEGTVRLVLPTSLGRALLVNQAASLSQEVVNVGRWVLLVPGDAGAKPFSLQPSNLLSYCHVTFFRGRLELRFTTQRPLPLEHGAVVSVSTTA